MPALGERDFSRVRRFFSGEELQERTFAAAASADEHRELSGGEGQIDVLQHLARPARALGASDDKVCRQGRVALFHVADSDFVHVRVLVSFSALYYTNCAAKVQPGAQKRGAPQAARPEFIKIKDLRRRDGI